MTRSSRRLLVAGLLFSVQTWVCFLTLGVLFAQEKTQEQKEKTAQEAVERKLPKAVPAGKTVEWESLFNSQAVTQYGKAPLFQAHWEDFSQKSIDQLVMNLESHPEDVRVVRALWERGDERATPVLRETFQKLDTKYEKQFVALALLKVGKKDDKENETVWNYLVRHAKSAVEDKTPFPLEFVDGRIVGNELSREFLAWCAQRDCEPTREAQEALLTGPADVLILAVADDPRANPIFRKGLKSKNYMIVARSAQGLAILQDGSAVSEIIDACRKAPAEAAATIAQSLVFFQDGPEANEAADEFIVNKELLYALRMQAKAKGPKKGVLGLR